MQKATETTHCITCQLKNTHGIHIRTAAILSEICEKYDASVIIKSPKGESDGADMMRLLMLEATCDTYLTLEATGNQAKQVLAELEQCIASGFHDKDMN